MPRPMPTPFDRFGYTEATQTVANANAASEVRGMASAPLSGSRMIDSSPRAMDFTGTVSLVRRMLAGDMWLDGLGWIGPRPGPTETGYSETMAILALGFVSQNALADVIDRHVAGVLGNEPRWGVAARVPAGEDGNPSDEQQKLIAEAEGLLTEWWDARKVHKALIRSARTLLFARRGPFRLYVPKGKLATRTTDGEDGRPTTIRVVPTAEGDVAGGLAVVWPEDPLPEKATVAEDPDSKESIGVVVFQAGRTVTGLGGGGEAAELSYLSEEVDGNGRRITFIRQTGPNVAAVRETNTRRPGVARLRLGGRLPVYEMQRDPFVTAQMIQIQRAINLALSALPRNVVTGGWLERVIANAQMPGKWVTDPEARGGKRWVPDKHTTGAGSTTYLKGLKQEDVGSGSVSYATPSVTFRDPSPVEPTVDAHEALYRAMLREAKQEHILVSQATAASDKSREQARADFEMTLRPTAAEVNACGRWLIETALAMAEEFANQPGRFTDDLRAVFECQIDTGPITGEERTAIDASVEAGTLSVETGMALEGVADPAAELARINAQPGAELSIIERQLTAVAAAANAGLDIEGAAIAVGMDPALARKLVPQFDPNAPKDGGNPNDPAAGPPADGGGE